MQVKISFFGIANSSLLFYKFISLKYTENVVTLPTYDKIEVSTKVKNTGGKIKIYKFSGFQYHVPFS